MLCVCFTTDIQLDAISNTRLNCLGNRFGVGNHRDDCVLNVCFHEFL